MKNKAMHALKKAAMSHIVFICLAILMTPPAHAQQTTSASSATFATIPETNQTEDIRGKVIQAYLENKHSPLSSQANILVQRADENKIDWKLLLAISGVESGYCNEIPAQSYNCWGFGIYGNHVRYFSSWDDAISTISSSIHNDYMNKWHAQTVGQIGRIYAADPNWSYKVTKNMDEITALSNKYASASLPISL